MKKTRAGRCVPALPFLEKLKYIERMNPLMIEPMTGDAWEDVRRIYVSGIATKNATFETQAPEWDVWDNAHRKDCRLIARIDGRITGWAALSNVSNRCVYAGVAELSIYVDEAFRGRGVGDALMKALISESELQSIWTLQAGILIENEGSIRLHLKHGFRKVGVRERLGRMDGRWRDVALFERRSTVIGID
jgi:L-amino acid N-acyltransferase YncA